MQRCCGVITERAADALRRSRLAAQRN